MGSPSTSLFVLETYLLKELICLFFGVSQILGFADFILMVYFNMSLCSLYFL